MNKFNFLLMLSLSMICMGQMSTDFNPDSRAVIVSPQTRVRVGFDYDGDNRVDAYEYIEGRDLMMLSPASRGQMEPDWPIDKDMQYRNDELTGMHRYRRPLSSLSGDVDDLKQVRLTGLQERHVIAKIKAEDNKMHAVDLGPKSQVDQLSLDEGDWISVRGVPGSINGNKMLMATQISTKDQQTQILLPEGRRELRFAGKVKETSVRSLGPDRPNHTLALVELKNDEKVVVDLGSSTSLKEQDVDIDKNDQIVFLAYPARYQGKNLLSATRLSIDDEVHIIDQNRRLPL